MNLEKMIPDRRAALLDENLKMESLESMVQSFLASWDRHFEENGMPKLCPDEGWWLQVQSSCIPVADLVNQFLIFAPLGRHMGSRRPR